jgi:hypothetical protein
MSSDTQFAVDDTGDSPGAKDQAKDAAAQTGHAAKGAATDVASTATDQAKQVTAEAGAQAKDLLGQAKGQATDQAGAQKDKAVGTLRSLSDEFDRMADGNDQPGIATDLTRQVSGHARTVADWLDEREPGDLLEELRGLARRRPGGFLLGAVAAGVLAGRATRGVKDATSNDSPATPTAATSVSRDPSPTPSVPALPTADIYDDGFSRDVTVAEPTVGITDPFTGRVS